MVLFEQLEEALLMAVLEVVHSNVSDFQTNPLLGKKPAHLSTIKIVGGLLQQRLRSPVGVVFGKGGWLCHVGSYVWDLAQSLLLGISGAV